MEDIKSKHEFVKLIAKRAGFTHGDVEIILNTIIDIFVEATVSRATIFVRGFGNLYYMKLPARKGSPLVTGSNGMLPEIERVVFKLSKTIRKKIKDTE